VLGAPPPGAAPPRGPLLLRALARAGAGLGPAEAAPPADLEARLAAAGNPAGMGPRELLAAKLAAAAVGSAAGVALVAVGAGRLALLLVPAAPVAGFLAPDLWLARRAAERARRMRAELPALLDLLRVRVEAGGSLAESLRAVGARTHGPLAAEWRAVGRQVALGVPLDAALARMAGRAPLPELAALVAALQRARRHGVPLADTLAAQSRDTRFALARHAREQAARAGPKIQLVVALLLVPSVLLLVAAALLAALLSGAAGAGGAGNPGAAGGLLQP
jgi:tight adherence protein C